MIKEKELKGIISEETYKELLAKGWEKEKLQINFYYSNDLLINRTEVTIRIRCIKNQMFLQIKVKEKQSEGIRLSKEYEKKMDIISNTISEEELRDVWENYVFGDVQLIGFLITERKIIEKDGVEIDIDKNIYEGITDYEVEFEFNNDNTTLDKIIKDIGLADKLYLGESKFERFKRVRSMNC